MTSANQSGEYCTLCERPATASWHESGTVAVCQECAVEILPALIADAVVLKPVKGRDQVKAVLKQVESRFWRAFTMRLLKDGR